MGGPRHVYVCPACKHYAEADEVDAEKPVCTTDGCEREGKILSLMWLCPACEKCFQSQEAVEEHGKNAHDM